MLTFTIMCPIKVNMIKYQDEATNFTTKECRQTMKSPTFIFARKTTESN